MLHSKAKYERQHRESRQTPKLDIKLYKGIEFCFSRRGRTHGSGTFRPQRTLADLFGSLGPLIPIQHSEQHPAHQPSFCRRSSWFDPRQWHACYCFFFAHTSIGQGLLEACFHYLVLPDSALFFAIYSRFMFYLLLFVARGLVAAPQTLQRAPHRDS